MQHSLTAVSMMPVAAIACRTGHLQEFTPSTHVSITDDVLLEPLDSSFPDQPVLVTAHGRHYEVRGDTKRLLAVLSRDGKTIAEIKREMEQTGNGVWDIPRFKRVLNSLVSFSLITLDGRTTEDNPKQGARPRQKGYLLVRIPILKPQWLLPVTRNLGKIFSRKAVGFGLPILAAGQVFFWYLAIAPLVGSPLSVTIAIHTLNIRLFCILFVANYVGLLVHELGHAAACVRSRITHGPIGVGLYWIFPSFYTEVSEAWRLSCIDRMVVDAGGMFMSAWCATIASVGFIVTGSLVFLLAAAIYDLTILFNLNPFLRMDGYWLVADALGVQQLMDYNRELTSWLFGRLLGARKLKPRIFSLSSQRRAIYFVYYAFWVTFAVYACFELAIWYIPHLATYLPELCAMLAHSFRTGDAAAIAKNAITLTFSVLPLIGFVIYASHAIRKACLWIFKETVEV